MEPQKTLNNQKKKKKNPEKEEIAGSLIFSDFKLCYKATVIKTV